MESRKREDVHEKVPGPRLMDSHLLDYTSTVLYGEGRLPF